MARPKKTIDFEALNRLLNIGCTGEECASVLNIDYDTLNAICKREKEINFSEYIKKGNYDFKISLRRLQYRSAQGIIKTDKDDNTKMNIIIPPSVTMQIWLGKQFLNQSDKQEITGKDGTELMKWNIQPVKTNGDK